MCIGVVVWIFYVNYLLVYICQYAISMSCMHFITQMSTCVNFQASEDAKKLVDEERAFARAEIESARAAVQRVEESLQEHEQMSRASGKQVIQGFN